MKYVQNFSIIILLVHLTFQLLSQRPNYNAFERNEIINYISTDSGYRSQISYTGHTQNEAMPIYIYFNALEKINDIEVFEIKKNNKEKQLKKIDIKELPYFDTQSFYTGTQIDVFDIPADIKYKYVYNKEVKESIFLDKLRFYDAFKVDTFRYEVQFSSAYKLKFDIQNPEAYSFLQIDSIVRDDSSKYIFTGAADSLTAQPTNYKFVRSIQKKPYVRLIVTPVSYKGQENVYFNNLLKHKINPQTQLSEDSKKLIDQITYGYTNEDSIILSILNWATTKIKYLDIEVGINGIIPKDVNKTISRLEGDCKDYSNFICQSLQYKGFKARLAIAPTTTHDGDMDFPAICGANHMVCVLYRNDKKLILDGTIKGGIYTLPSISVQGKHLFILGEDDYEIYYIDPVASHSNLIENTFNIKVDSGSLSGKSLHTYHGLSSIYFRNLYKNSNSGDFNDLIAKSKNSKGLTFKNITYEDNVGDFIIFSDIEINESVYTNAGNRNILLLSFVPFPHNLPFRLKEKNHAYAFLNTFESKFYAEIEFPDTIENISFNEVQFNTDGFEFNIVVSAKGNYLKIEYFYKNKNLIIQSQEIETYNSLNALIKKTLNQHAVKFY